MKSKLRIKNFTLIIALLIILSMGYFILFEFKNIEKEKTDLNLKNALLLGKHILLQEDIELDRMLIGQEIKIDSLARLSKNKGKNDNKYKILMIADIFSCRNCLDNAVDYYADYIKKNNFENEIEISLIIQGADEKQTKASYGDYFEKNLAVFMDKNCEFMRNYDVMLIESIVLFLNKQNICVYSYLIDQETPQKHSLMSPIIYRAINNNL